MKRMRRTFTLMRVAGGHCRRRRPDRALKPADPGRTRRALPCDPRGLEQLGLSIHNYLSSTNASSPEAIMWGPAGRVGAAEHRSGPITACPI